MRTWSADCETARLELTAPTGRLGAPALADHLGACPACADLAARLARLDAAWTATRPAEPDPAAVDALWARLSHTLDTGAPTPAFSLAPLGPVADDPVVAPLGLVPGPTPARSPARRGGHAAWIAALLAPAAAAAALLIAGPGRFRPDPAPAPGPLDPAPVAVAAIPVAYELEQGETAIIRIGAGDVGTALVLPGTDEVSDTEPVLAAFDVLNYMESIGSQGSL